MQIFNLEMASRLPMRNLNSPTMPAYPRVTDEMSFTEQPKHDQQHTALEVADKNFDISVPSDSDEQSPDECTCNSNNEETGMSLVTLHFIASCCDHFACIRQGECQSCICRSRWHNLPCHLRERPCGEIGIPHYHLAGCLRLSHLVRWCSNLATHVCL